MSMLRLFLTYHQFEVFNMYGNSSEVNSAAVNETISYSISYCLHGNFKPCSASNTGNRAVQATPETV
ncbi:hypothetical protein HZ326_22943 [Fusarium oxysporum f. sp. albedinis]|nr:hypothetical protein HZ326_22943 [Fusarium oxysporum f. sp. albedinis]